MNDRQQNQLNAAQTTSNFLQQPDNQAIWNALDAFAEGVTKAQGSINIIHTLAQIQAGTTTGITFDKQRLRTSVENRLIIAAKAAVSYGQAINNGDLVAQANALNSRHELKQIRDGAMDDHAQLLYDRIHTLREADSATASKYGFKKEPGETLLQPLLAAIIAFGAVVETPRSAIIAKAGATAGIDSEMHRLQQALKDLDNLVVQFEEEHPTFVHAYRDSRKIIDLGHGSEKPAASPPPPARKFHRDATPLSPAGCARPSPAY